MTTTEETDAPHFSYARFQETAPAAVAALRALTKAVEDAGLEKDLIELVKLRVSQINGCAFCLAFHLDAARRLGIAQGKLDLIAAWRDAPVFSARERAALAFAERVTGMAAAPVTADAHAALLGAFSEAEAMHLTVSIATINAWNRIAGGLHFPPLAPRRG
ncbi:carboxymuconolactone decarboxylase family protein [Xanthobacter pseudotagetidis]|uniref:carboxymuconolactone decarboxylase family protein n=1 Tax=Xanthobacter pseudotagetidis TaxID=3119911 RepID=UPI0037289DC9